MRIIQTNRLRLCLTLAACGLLAACAPGAPATLLPSPGVAASAAATAAATSRPTETSTLSPSATPTVQPSATPTARPSETPAASASPAPTLTPTGALTAAGPFTASGSFFALSVADLQASTQWYMDKLGLKITLQPPKSNGASVVVLEGNGLIVELIQADGSVALTQVAPKLTDRTQLRGLVKAGVIVDDFDQTVARLRANHVTIAFGPYPASAEQRANVIIQDNEGNLIQFFGK